MKVFNSAITDELSEEEAAIFYLLTMQFDSTYRYTDCDIDLAFGGLTFQARGFEPGNISVTSGLGVDSVDLSIDNADLSMSSIVLNEDISGLPVILGMTAVSRQCRLRRCRSPGRHGRRHHLRHRRRVHIRHDRDPETVQPAGWGAEPVQGAGQQLGALRRPARHRPRERDRPVEQENAETRVGQLPMGLQGNRMRLLGRRALLRPVVHQVLRPRQPAQLRRVPVSAVYIGDRGMVGNDAKINLSELTGKFVGKPWSMYSCIGLMHDFYTEIDIDVPDEYKGVKLEEAIDYWKKAPREALLDMVGLFRTLGKDGNPKDLKQFDLLVLKRYRAIYPAIYLYGGRYITSTLKEGVAVGMLGADIKVLLVRSLI